MTALAGEIAFLHWYSRPVDLQKIQNDCAVAGEIAFLHWYSRPVDLLKNMSREGEFLRGLLGI